ncbi:hypothetical protein D3C75_352750 [compost metagenome]
MTKPAIRRLLPPALVLLAALLLPGCTAPGANEAAAPSGGSATATAAAQSPQPPATASPQPGDAAVTAPPSAPAGNVPPSPAAAAPATPPAGSSPAGTAPPDTSRPAATAAAPPAKGAGLTAPAAAKPSAAGGPSAGAAKPAVTPSPAATAKAAAAAQPAAAADTAVISITGDDGHGVILAPAAFEIKQGESVLDLLKRITRQQKIQMEFQGAKGFAYVEGIDNLYELDYGAESGWMYRVNGEFPDKSAGSYTVQPGDTIEWLYTLDLGKDIGAKAP